MKNKTRKKLNKDESDDTLVAIPESVKDLCKNDDILKIINQLNNSNNVEQQIRIIHSFAAFMNSAQNVEIILKILSFLFINSVPKHPVKVTVLRIFNSNKHLNKEISAIISEELLKLIETENKRNEYMNSINVCFNNFAAGIDAVSLILDRVFKFLIDSLHFYLKELRCTSSPIEIIENHKHIHNATRAIVAVSQQCENINTIYTIHAEEISKICLQILNNPDILYDTKNNCGIILTIASNTEFEDGYKILLNFINKNISIDKWEIGEINDELVITCIFNGVLNVVSADKLCAFQDNFVNSDIYQITDKLLDILKKSSDKPSIIIGVNRTLLVVSRLLTALSTENVTKILPRLLDNVWIQLDHNIDTIRHVSKSILTNLVKLSSHNDNQSCILNIIIESVLSIPPFKNGRYVALSVIGNEIGCNILIQKYPNLIEELQNSVEETAVASYVTSCYENLMKCHLKETSVESWLNIWVFPLILKLEEQEELDEKGSCYQKLLINAIKLRPSIIELILSRWSTENDLQFNLLLNCALIARKIGVDIKNDTKWRGILDYSVLDLAMCHQNDEVRICSLSLISDSHKTTEIFTKWEFDFTVKFLYYNINTQMPSTRQNILFLMKKILVRFSESYYAIIRTYTKMPQNTQEYKTLHEQKSYYEEFVYNLRACIFDSLFPGANFSRRIICLEVLTFLEPIWSDVLKVSDDQLWKQEEADALLLCLDDSYESNKQVAVNLLKKCPLQLLKLNTVENSKEYIENALKLSSSIKPADTVTAAYMLETFMYSEVTKEVLTQLLNADAEQSQTSEYLILTLLLNYLQEQIDVGEKNLLKAAGSSPFYGTLFCIRHLLEKYLHTSKLHEPEWRLVIGRIISTCFTSSAIVCPVVNSSSPEGHLPMDHETVQSEEQTVTAQMLLVCAWRTVKEVSLLLGEIALRANVEGENENGFVTQEQIKKIGEHFTVLLTETKHRGAFEQAYVGFTKLCNRLWRCKSENLHQLPISWLNDILEAISGKTKNDKLCATRRSAGVPFMIQAIVASELQTGGSTHFHNCLQTLLEHANNTENVETRTHSMNILRALYKHTQLGEEISPYIAQGVVASINGFSRKTWAERNSSTLLFSSLMTRTFGVQRTKDTEHLNMRNKMTAKVFFLRYPILYEFLLHKLQEITDDNCDYYKTVALYPILLLLARLYPTNAEENESNNQLQSFVPFIRACAKNKNLRTRELAAKALVPLVQSQQRIYLIKELFVLLRNRNGSSNFVHGILIQIVYLLSNIKEDLEVFVEEIKNTQWLLLCNTENCCPIITALYMQIIFKIISRKSQQQISLKIFDVISSQNNYVLQNVIVGKDVYYRQAINLQILILIQEANVSKICEFLYENIQHESTDVKGFILNFLMYLLKSNITDVYMDSLELPEEEKLLAELISEDLKQNIISSIKSKNFTQILKTIIEKNGSLMDKSLFILYNLQENMNELLESDMNCLYLLEKYSDIEDITNVILSFLPIFVRYAQDNLDDVLEKVLEITSPRNNYSCRYYAALTLLELKPLIFEENTIDTDNLILMWKIVMILLSDSEPIVRNTISKLASNFPTAEKAREELLIKCTQVLNKISPEKCISLLLFWSLCVYDSDDDDEDMEFQIFERGEVSTYVEDMCLSKLAAKTLQNIIHSSNLTVEKIVAILEEDKQLWNGYNLDKYILISILQEMSQHNDIKSYFNSDNTLCNLDVYTKYKVVNIVKAILY